MVRAMRPPTPFRSHGDGRFRWEDFRARGDHLIFENGVLVFHPENISLGNNIYVGHRTILKGYYKSSFVIGDDVWIGQDCFLHAAGGLTIGSRVGIGPKVSILTSIHQEEGRQVPILFSELQFAAVTVEDDCDIGLGAIILPGVRIQRGAQVGAGAVVTHDLPPYVIAAGVPARVLRERPLGSPPSA
jgi:acetyltransferase-like isoleucine patch superfamily enzyme